MPAAPGRRPLRLLQTLALGAALFALLGACGLPLTHPQRPRFQPVRPIVIRVSGTWVAVPIDGPPFRPLRLTLHQAGASVDAVLHMPDRSLAAESPARIDSRGQLGFRFGRPPEHVDLWLQLEARPPGLSGMLTDADGRKPVRFVRR